MDAVEQRHRIVRLVGLQLADQMQRDLAVFRPRQQGGPFLLRFLHPVFTEHPLSLSDQRRDGRGRMSLADRDQCDVLRLAPRNLRGAGNAVANIGERGGCVFHRRPL